MSRETLRFFVENNFPNFNTLDTYAGVSYDTIGKELFPPLSLHEADFPLYNSSNYAITFQHILPRNMYSMYYLMYHLRIYGIKRRFPPAP